MMRGSHSAASSGWRAAPARPSRSSRSGSRGRPRPATSSMNFAARATWAPGRGSRQGSACSSWPSEAHQLVPGGVELDLVDAVAVAVVGAQHRRVLVGLVRRVAGLGRAGEGADGAASGPRPTPAPSRAPPRRAPGRPRRRCSRPAAVAGWRHCGSGTPTIAERRHGGVLPIARVQKSIREAIAASGSPPSLAGDSGPTSASPIAPTSAAAAASGSWGASSPDSTPSASTPASTSR